MSIKQGWNGRCYEDFEVGDIYPHPTGRRVVPRPLQWKYANDVIGRKLLPLYTKLASLRTHYEVLRSGAFNPDFWEEWQTQFDANGLGLDCNRQVMIYQRSGYKCNHRYLAAQ